MSMNCREHEDLASLLSEIRAGRDASFARLVDMYDALLRGQASRFAADGQEFEDVYQEACLALHRAALHYRETETVTFGLFARVCILNALKTRYKRERRSRRGGGRMPDFVPLEADELAADFSDPVEEKERFDELLSVIHAELSAYERKVFSMYIQDVPIAEIAESLGRNEKSVRNAISRLLAKLRAKLGNE